MARWLIRSAQSGVGVETQYSYRLVMQHVQGESTVMPLIYGSTKFFIPAGQTWNFTSAINGDPSNGGDYVGPLVAVGVADGLQQEVAITPTNVRFISRNSDGLTSQAVYDYSVTNGNTFGVLIRLDKFFNG